MIKKIGVLENCVLMNCGLCGKECGKQYPCEGCWVLFYCCEKHRKLHFRYFHHDECQRLAKQKNRELPSTRLSCSGLTIEEDLDQILREWNCSEGQFWKMLDEESELELWKEEDLCSADVLLFCWGLEAGVVPCCKTRILQTTDSWYCSWNDYYSVRGIPNTSPVALVMQFPLSLYFALMLRFVLDPQRPLGTPCGVNVWYLGIEQELKILPLFFEIGSLLPEWNLRITFVGPEIPESWNDVEFNSWNPKEDHCPTSTCSCHNSKTPEASSLNTYFFDILNHSPVESDYSVSPPGAIGGSPKGVKLSFKRGLYHEVVRNEIPDLVFCPNAGLEVYDSWIETLQVLSIEKVFSVFTDYTEEAIYRSSRFLNSLDLSPKHTFLNPFRCPLTTQKGGLSTLCFSNGFGFVLNN